MSILATWLLLAEDGDGAAPLVYRGRTSTLRTTTRVRAGWRSLVPNRCHPGVRNREMAAGTLVGRRAGRWSGCG